MKSFSLRSNRSGAAIMKICVCTIGRLENDYIEEFIEHYRSLGVDNIFLYSHFNPENFRDVIKDENFVKITDVTYPCTEAVYRVYHDCYTSTDYDWYIFEDPDEYLNVPNNDIKSYLSNITGDCICVNWRNYDDNDLIYKDSRPLNERFTREIDVDSTTVKSIVRGGLDIKFTNPHIPEGNIVFVDGDNKVLESHTRDKIPYVTYNNAYIKHFRDKTIEEYCTNKIPKLKDFGYNLVNFNLNHFFKYNK